MKRFNNVTNDRLLLLIFRTNSIADTLTWPTKRRRPSRNGVRNRRAVVGAALVALSLGSATA